MMNYHDGVPDIVFLRHRSSGWYGRSMRYNKTIRSETREAWNKNCMDAGGVFFFLVARAVGRKCPQQVVERQEEEAEEGERHGEGER